MEKDVYMYLYGVGFGVGTKFRPFERAVSIGFVSCLLDRLIVVL